MDSNGVGNVLSPIDLVANKDERPNSFLLSIYPTQGTNTQISNQTDLAGKYSSFLFFVCLPKSKVELISELRDDENFAVVALF